MVGEETTGDVGSSCLFWIVAAFLIGLAIAIVLWFVVARVEPEAAPDGEGPIEAAEPPEID
ncbi:MAG: hypothetical protein M3552_04640 [Planctomycetota bacterium]|nr:hypothetical protein [Planctomycetaceae bacterium]MDQ3329927.1 hypothetical protein [Planctomycetota bacterium]